MSGTGVTFTGCIGCGGAQFPTAILSRTSFEAGGATVTRTLAAPAGIKVGQLMLTCVSAGSYAGGSPWTFTPDPAWTAVYADPTFGGGEVIVSHLYSKIADAADEAGTSSYSWSLNVPGGLAGMAVAVVGWERQFGTTISTASANHTLSPSVASPGGDWQFAFVTQRTASNFVQPEPDPVVTSTATLLVSRFGSYRPGAMRVYASNNVSPITGAYLQGGIDFPRQALVVASITT